VARLAATVMEAAWLVESGPAAEEASAPHCLPSQQCSLKSFRKPPPCVPVACHSSMALLHAQAGPLKVAPVVELAPCLATAAAVAAAAAALPQQVLHWQPQPEVLAWPLGPAQAAPVDLEALPLQLGAVLAGAQPRAVGQELLEQAAAASSGSAHTEWELVAA